MGEKKLQNYDKTFWLNNISKKKTEIFHFFSSNTIFYTKKKGKKEREKRKNYSKDYKNYNKYV